MTDNGETQLVIMPAKAEVISVAGLLAKAKCKRLPNWTDVLEKGPRHAAPCRIFPALIWRQG